MNTCPKCGTATDGLFCPKCGARVSSAPQAAPAAKAQPTQTVVNVQTKPIEKKEDLPEKFRPLGAWAYFGYGLLFSIPVVGFVFLIVFSFSGTNINRRSYARSYWCWTILLAALFLIAFLILLFTGGFAALIALLSQYGSQINF